MIVPHEVVVFYIIEVASLALALDADTEHVLDVFLVTDEGGAWYGQASTHLRFHPTFVQFLKSEATCAIKGVGNPNVLLEYIGYFHGIRRFNGIQIKAFYAIPSKIMRFFSTCSRLWYKLR